MEMCWVDDYNDYRYSFNNQERDDEIKGAGNSINFGARMYDPRLGRWLSIDPMASVFPSESPYVAFHNNPMYYPDPSGMAPFPFVQNYIYATQFFTSELTFGSVYQVYNTEIWQEVLTDDGKQTGYIQMKEGYTPADAIDDFHCNPELYNADCAEVIQISRLFAMKETLGDAAFNKVFESTDKNSANTYNFYLGDHSSSGTGRLIEYQRDKAGDRWFRTFNSEAELEWVESNGYVYGTEYEATDQDILSMAKVGDRLVISNIHGTGDFQNENFSKIGEDTYTAQGFSDNTFSYNDIVLKLAGVTYGKNKLEGESLQEYADRAVFLSGIEQYPTVNTPTDD